MTQAARVVDGAVVEVVQIPDGVTLEEMFNPGAGFQQAANSVQVGWVVDGSGFKAPPTASAAEILAQAKVDALAAVNARRDQIIAGGYQNNFGASVGIRTLDQRGPSDDIAWLTVSKMATDLVASGSGDTPMKLRDAANQSFTCSASTADAAMSAMGQWRSSILANSWDLKDAISAASTKAALDAIDLTAGWPN